MSNTADPRDSYELGDLVVPSPAHYAATDVAPGVHRIVRTPTGRGTRYRTEPLSGAGKGVHGPAATLLEYTGTEDEARAYVKDARPLAHPNPVGTTAEQDMRARWLPSPEQVEQAVAKLREVNARRPGDWLAAVPLVQPGKEFGWWTVGQPVEHVPGVYLGLNSFDQEPSYATARNMAADTARRFLGDRPGTVAWATIRADGSATVSEDPPLTLE